MIINRKVIQTVGEARTPATITVNCDGKYLTWTLYHGTEQSTASEITASGAASHVGDLIGLLVCRSAHADEAGVSFAVSQTGATRLVAVDGVIPDVAATGSTTLYLFVVTGASVEIDIRDDRGAGDETQIAPTGEGDE